MDTTSDNKATNGTSPSPYKRISGALWAGFRGDGNFEIGHRADDPVVVVERADLDALRAALGVSEAARGDTISAATAGWFFEEHKLAIQALQTRLDAIVDGRSEAMRLLADRMEALEKRVQSNYDYVTQRLNKTDETVGLNFRSNREEHNQIAVQLNGDGSEENPGIKTQLAQLAMLADAINTAQENQAALIEKIAPGSAKPVELPKNIATKEYVDAAAARLSGALREHIANVMAEAVRLAKPAPGLLQRIVKAVKNEPAVPERPTRAQRATMAAAASGLTPERAAAMAALGAQAAMADERGGD